MSEKKPKTVPVKRTHALRGTPVAKIKTVTTDGDADRETHDRVAFDEFFAAATRVSEVVHHRSEEARRENAEFRFGPDYEREIQDLKANKAALIKVIAALENLKKALNQRMGDIKWLRDQFDPAHADHDEF